MTSRDTREPTVNTMKHLPVDEQVALLRSMTSDAPGAQRIREQIRSSTGSKVHVATDASDHELALIGLLIELLYDIATVPDSERRSQLMPDGSASTLETYT
jgi:hypothetical protein